MKSDVLRIGLLALLLLCRGASAAPTDRQPTAPLAVSDNAQAKNAVELAATFYDQAAPAIERLSELRDTGKLAQVKILDAGQAHLALVRLERQVDHLRALGEPAGEDYALRLRPLREKLTLVINDAEKIPAIDKQLKQAYTALRQQVRREAAAITKAERLAKGGKWEAAQEILHNAQDDWEPLAGWFSGRTRSSATVQFIDPLRIVNQKVQQQREEQAQTELKTAREAKLPDYDAILAEINAAVSALAGSATAPYGDQQRTGPELVRAAAERWKQAQLATVHCIGLDWARGQTTRGSSELAELFAEQQKFAAAMPAALAAVVAADARRASGDEARQLYQQYLATFAPLISEAASLDSADHPLWDAIASPLDDLAGKAPALADEVAAYRAATDDLLRWRQRTAAAYAVARSGDFPPLEEVYLAAAKQTDHYAGLVASDAANTSEAELQGSVADVFPPLVQALHQKQVTCRDIVGLDGSDRLAIGRYAQRHYSRVARADVAQAIAELEADLLVDASNPPLSLAAAAGLESARSGDLAAAGGPIAGLALEALATRYRTLPAAGRQLLPLDAVPQEPTTNRPLIQVLTRIDVNPKWIQHPMFFVELQ